MGAFERVLFVWAPGVVFGRHEQGLLHRLPVARRTAPVLCCPGIFRCLSHRRSSPARARDGRPCRRRREQFTAASPWRGRRRGGEAAWHHNAAFASEPRGSNAIDPHRGDPVSPRRPGLGHFEGVAHAPEGLKAGIARLRCGWESDHPGGIGRRQGHRAVAVPAASTIAETDPGMRKRRRP